MRNPLQFLQRPGQATCVLCLALLADNRGAHAGEFRIEFTRPGLDRWMYPFNASPGCRASAPVFGALDPASGVDSRQGQFLVGFDLIAQTVTNCGVVTDQPALLATNRGPAHYLLRHVRFTATINRDRVFAYDPTPDAHTSFLPAGDPAFTPDMDEGRPVELFGTGYRHGWDAATFREDAPFGSPAPGQRNAFAAGFDPHGRLVDVGNSVGKTNGNFAPFATRPFAVGVATGLTAGEPVPAGTTLRFELNLANPRIRRYVQEGLDAGRLRFTVTSLAGSSFGGQPAWPDFFTRDHEAGIPPTLEIAGTLVETTDDDRDGLPDDWERFYFLSLAHTAADDTDGDGESNGRELAAGTDPADATSVLRLRVSAAPDGAVALRFPGLPGLTLEQSDDGRTWTAIPAGQLRCDGLTGEMQWQSPAHGTPARLFRARLP